MPFAASATTFPHALRRFLAALLAVALLGAAVGCSVNRGDQLADQFASYLEEHPAVESASGTGLSPLPFSGSVDTGRATLKLGSTVEDAESVVAWAKESEFWDDVREISIGFAGNDATHHVVVSKWTDADAVREMFEHAASLRARVDASPTAWAGIGRTRLVSRSTTSGEPGAYTLTVTGAPINSAYTVFTDAVTSAPATDLAYVSVTTDDESLTIEGMRVENVTPAYQAYVAVWNSYPVTEARVGPGSLYMRIDTTSDNAAAVEGLVESTASTYVSLTLEWLNVENAPYGNPDAQGLADLIASTGLAHRVEVSRSRIEVGAASIGDVEAIAAAVAAMNDFPASINTITYVINPDTTSRGGVIGVNAVGQRGLDPWRPILDAHREMDLTSPEYKLWLSAGPARNFDADVTLQWLYRDHSLRDSTAAAGRRLGASAPDGLVIDGFGPLCFRIVAGSSPTPEGAPICDGDGPDRLTGEAFIPAWNAAR